jgi:hypothetical protein
MKTSDGVPMVRHTGTKVRKHSFHRNEMWLLWDDYFSKFSRNADGSIAYDPEGYKETELEEPGEPGTSGGCNTGAGVIALTAGIFWAAGKLKSALKKGRRC